MHIGLIRCRTQGGDDFQRACSLCGEWKREILTHHTNQNNVIYWGNCSPPLWPIHAWEVAKVYMPRGQSNRQGPEKCDVAALLNLINFCDQFDFVERQKVIEIIKCRNELMHSVEMSVSAKWLDNYRWKILEFLQEFRHIPEAKAADKMIKEIALSNWQVQITEKDTVDALKITDEINADMIFNAELELIREWVKELCFTVEEQEVLHIQHLNSLNTFKEFLKQNKELESVLHQEVEHLYSLEQKLKSGIRTVNDQDGEEWNLEEKEHNNRKDM
ncbi:uncharacterized protein CXorf38 isoform X2 [Mustelus asterias]